MIGMEPITASAARFAGSSLLRVQNDERLAALAALDNQAAFEALAKRYRPSLLRASRKLLSEASAEDAVQQAFLRAHQALLRNGPPQRVRPWLYKITVNCALLLASQPAEILPLDEERMDGVERPDEAYERRQRLRETVGAIHTLPAGQRRALVARELEGRSHEEIAAELGLSEGGARQLIYRARASVRSAASALTPPALLTRLLAGDGSEAGQPVVEIAAGSTAGGLAAKAALVTLIAGGMAGGAALAPLPDWNPERQFAEAGERGAKQAQRPISQAHEAGSAEAVGVDGSGDDGGGSSGPGPGEGQDGHGGASDGSGHQVGEDGGSESGSSGPSASSGDDSSGSGDDGSSGSGESGDGGSGSSGSGSGDSGSSGSGSSDSGSSVSGSGESGSSGSGSGELFPSSDGSGSSSDGSSGSGSGDDLPG